MIWRQQCSELSRVLILHDVVHSQPGRLSFILSFPFYLLDHRRALVCMVVRVDEDQSVRGPVDGPSWL
jgi:hypothetical protein